MRDRYIIVDNFYQDPDSVRKIFLDMETDDGGNNWAGVTSNLCLFDEGMRDFISHLVGHPIDGNSNINGKFRFSKAFDPYKQDIHFDPSPGQLWAGVVYMTPDELVPNKEEAGTIFWKHKERNLEQIPFEPEQLQAQGWNGYNDLLKFLETEGMDRSLWEKTFTIPHKYNRLVLFRPWLFHSPGFAFGDTKENCRMIQTFFLKAREEETNE